MKKFKIIIKLVILFSLVISSFIVLYYFFYYNQVYESDSTEIKVNRLITIIYFVLSFYILFFLMNYKFYSLFFIFIIISGTLIWIILYLLDFFKINLSFWNLSTIRTSAAILGICIISPGFTLYIMKYIKNHSNQNEKGKIFRNYHIHEGFVGIIFVIIAFFLLMIRYLLIQYEVMREELRIFLAITMILLYLFLFSGSFLIFRDRRDIIKLKFIEQREIKINNNDAWTVFNPITAESVQFFKSPKLLFYPFGILFNSFSVNMLIHGTLFLPEKIFGLKHEIVVFIGFILCIISSGIIGVDWYRLFAKIYPKLYQEIEQVLNGLRI